MNLIFSAASGMSCEPATKNGAMIIGACMAAAWFPLMGIIVMSGLLPNSDEACAIILGAIFLAFVVAGPRMINEKYRGARCALFQILGGITLATSVSVAVLFFLFG